MVSPRKDQRRPGPGRLPAGLRVVGTVLVFITSFALLPGIVLAVGAATFERHRYAPPDRTPEISADPPAHDPGRPTAVVVVGNGGANVADVLAPYEVLAGTGAFNVYVVAPERRPVTLLGGLDVLPDLSFAELDRRLEGAAPDVTVVPELLVADRYDRPVIEWLRGTASRALVLAVCSGARLVAAAGLLDGREATSHWYRLNEFGPDHPEVRWRRGIRYVDAGPVITTGGLLSSVDGSLRVVERLVGQDAAAEAARRVGWPGYSPGRPAEMPISEITWAERGIHLLNQGFRSTTTRIGVAVTDGVSELELASAFAPYGEIRSARTVALGAEVVRSRHGLTFFPRQRLDEAGRTDLLLVPGADAARRHPEEVDRAAGAAGVRAVYPHGGPGFAFDPVLRLLAETTDVPNARWAAKVLEYSPAAPALTGPAVQWPVLLAPLGLGVGGLAFAAGVAVLISRRR